ncbi:extracellular solute-binding protein [bacterium]|nr:MAG: extracellular solute-binding protein [bacterium]
MNDKKVRFLRAALYFSFGAFMVLWILAFLQGCTPKTGTSSAPNAASAAAEGKEVVLYCSVDEVYAKPLIKKLEAQTGLKIKALFDTEATKTAGLANRIRAEGNRVKADVFWSSALLQTLLMSDEGILESYTSPAAKDLPAGAFGDQWAGVGMRARVLLSSKPQNAAVDNPFEDSFINSRLGVSNPQFGTATDWAVALTQRDGHTSISNLSVNEATFFERFKGSGVRVLPGNGDVARLVANGNLTYGWSDSDDFLAQKREKKPIYLVKTLDYNVLVPGAVSILKGAPHPNNAQKLFDAIASAQNEKALTQTMPGVFSLRHLNEKSNFQSGGQDFSFLQNTKLDAYDEWPSIWKKIREPLSEIFVLQ